MSHSNRIAIPVLFLATLIVTILAATTIADAQAPAPVTTATFAGWHGNDWYISGDVTLACAPPPGAACATTYYTVDGGPTQTYPGLITLADGTRTLTYWSTSTNGGTEPAQTTTVNVDATAPVVSVTRGCTTMGSSNWCRAGFSITESATDATSGIDASTYACTLDNVAVACGTQSITTDGQHTGFMSVRDIAQNLAQHSQTFKLDGTPPVASASRSPAANANGWNNADVVVSFTCTDATSGASAIPSKTVSTEGADQSRTGTCTDAAGNTASATVSGINIDKTAPVLTVTRTAPNANGWNSGPVTVTFTCTDSGSGVSSAPPNAILSTQGANQTHSGTCTDNAGNSATASLSNISIDRSVPVVTATQTPAPLASCAPAGGPLLADNFDTENGGIAQLNYVGFANWAVTRGGADLFTAGSTHGLQLDLDGSSLRGGVRLESKDVTLQPGCYLLQFRIGQNGAGPNSMTVSVGSLYSESVTRAAGDSSFATFSRQINVPATTTAKLVFDHAGADNFGIIIDEVLLAPLPGWSTSPVSITFSCTDAVSGVKTFSGSATIGADGADQSTSRLCFDFAGNVGGYTAASISVDQTAPDLTATRTAANANGWNSGDVAVDFTCTDATSGVDSAPDDATVATEGADQSVSGTCTDVAGNSATVTVSNINIDKTAPTLAAHADVTAEAADANGATVSYTSPTATDAVSGAGSVTCSPASGSTFAMGATTITCSVSDDAGNAATSTFAIWVVDTTPPTLVATRTAANANGWNSGDVLVDFTCTDAASGVASAPADVTLTAEGADQSVSRTCTDVAGNSASTTVGPISIDRTAPSMSHAQTPAANANGWNRDAVTVSFSCTDALSGVLTAPTNVALTGEGAGQSATGTCTDNAGNSGSATRSNVNIDLTGPTNVHEHACAASFSFGWCRSGLTTWESFADGLSGIDASTKLCKLDGNVVPCDEAQNVVGDGIHQQYGFVRDLAGNGFQSSGSVKFDGASPVLTATRTGANANGWNNGAVSLTYECTDETSGPRIVPADVTVSTEGAGQSVTRSCTDFAGNVASATVSSINIDLTAPVFDAYADLTVPANAANGATVAYAVPTAPDALSGIDTLACVDAPGSFFPLGTTTVGCVATDKAGNSASFAFTISVVPAPLDHIAVSGPDTMVAGTSATFGLAGFDAHGNVVPLAQDTLDYTAPQAVGAYAATYGEQGVTGSHAVSVVADALHHIRMSGPASLVVNAGATYELAGFDQYENGVPLAQTTLDVTAPTLAGEFTRSYTEQGVTGSTTILAVHDALATITVTGPASMIAGTTGTFSLAGFDQFDNDVPLAQTTIDHVASTSEGTDTVSYVESGVTGSADVTILHDALASITLAGPTTVVVATTHDYALSGHDQYGNTVPLAQTSVGFTAPDAVGTYVASYTEQGVTGTLDVQAVADELASIVLTGPSQMVAGTTATFSLAGFDQFGNAVALSQGSIAHTAPTTIGSTLVSYTEDGVTGSKDIAVVADALAQIDISGSATIMAGETLTYTLSGADQYGNPVPLAQTSLDFTAPTSVGPAVVSYAESGVTGTLDVNVVHHTLASIVVSGDDTIVAAHTKTYALAGFDAYGNDVPLAQTSLAFTAPTSAGTARVSYTETGVAGAKDVAVLADSLFSIVLSGPLELVAGTTADYGLAGFDQHGNDVPLAQPSVAFTASTASGPATVSYGEQGVTGTLDVTVIHDALASMTLTGPSTMVAGTTATFALAGFDQYGNDVPLAQAELDFTAPTLVGDATASYTELGVTASQVVMVVPDQTARMTITGPDTVGSGEVATFVSRGYDQYDNLAFTRNLAFTGPATLGLADVCDSEGAVSVCKAVEIVPGHIVRIAVSAQRTLINVDRPTTVSALAYDVYDHPVPTPAEAFTWAATMGQLKPGLVYNSSSAGNANVTARIGSVVGYVRIQVTAVLATDIAQATVVDYPSASKGLVNGTVTVRYVDHAPAANATVKVFVTDSLGRTTGPITVTTNATGVASYELPAAFLPGVYNVSATSSSGKNYGSDSMDYVVFVVDPGVL